MPTLYTSLAEIRSFSPCASGWKAICAAHPHSTEEEMNRPIRLVDCLNSNSFADVCWLIGKRKVEIQICVKAARLCADSVAHIKSASADASADAAAAATAVAYAAVAYAAAAAATVAYAAAAAIQTAKNKQFLIESILAYENGEI